MNTNDDSLVRSGLSPSGLLMFECIGDFLYDLERHAGPDGYVISAHPSCYSVRVRGAIGTHRLLSAAIVAAIEQDKQHAHDLSFLDTDSLEVRDEDS